MSSPNHLPSLAIIGAGVAGLGSAWLLRQHYRITLYERNNYPGGHSNTVTLQEEGREVPIDTGFMVYNHVTYPNLVRLFAALGVEGKRTDMSFSVQHLGRGLEYNGSSLNHLFAQRRNLLRPHYWQLLSRINRFNQEAVPALETGEAEGVSLGEYVARRGYGKDFLDLYLVPMSSAVWSTPPDRMLEFPAATLLRFFHNHGFLGLHTQHPWWTPVGGAKVYVRAILDAVQPEIRLEEPVAGVRRVQDGVEVRTRSGEVSTYDRVILASHADETLSMLEDADEEERAVLGSFRYQENEAWLHSDPSHMPQRPLCWASWNYRMVPGPDGKPIPSTIYWMNRLQGVSDKIPYFVSINPHEGIDEGLVHRRIQYHHPLFDLAAIQAQAKLPGLNRRSGSRVHFVGSYFRYGFHEDAFRSAVDLCRELVPDLKWET